jgi:hypothetical protein
VAHGKNILTLNGKRYDTVTGRMIPDDSISPAVKASKSVQKNTGTRPAVGIVDGIQKKKPARPQTGKVHAHAMHKKHQRSQTLMRTAVKKPVPAKTEKQPSKPLINSSAKVYHSNPTRELRARHIAQSSLVSKFGNRPGEMRPIAAPLQVAPAPEEPTVTNKSSLLAGTSVTRPMVNPFQSAIDNSTSHDQPKLKKPKVSHRVAKKLHVSSKFVHIGASAFIVLMLGSYFTYHNLPNLSMKVASTRAGVKGSLPGYKPSGFSMRGPISYQPGQLTVTFQSRTDDRRFTLTERLTEWNSETLLENHVAVDQKPYQTYKDRGKTIFIYNGGTATWIDNGVWYEVNGGDSLNSDQLLRIAASL